MMNLHELTQAYLNVLNMSDDTELDDEYIHDTLELLDSEIHDKAENYSRLIKALEDDILVLQKNIADLEKKAKKKKNLVDYLKGNLLFFMTEFDEKEIKTKTGVVKIVNNGGIKPMKVDEANVPVDYMKQIYEIDRNKIRDDLERGKELPFAKLEERGQHIVIK